MLRTVSGLVSAFGPRGLAGDTEQQQLKARSPFAVSSEEIGRFASALGHLDELIALLFQVANDPRWRPVHPWAQRGLGHGSTHQAAATALRPTAQNSPLIATFASNCFQSFKGLKENLEPVRVRNAMRGQIPEYAGMAIGLAPLANAATGRFVTVQNGMRRAMEFCSEPLPAIDPPSREQWNRITAAAGRVRSSMNDAIRSLGNVEGMWKALGPDLRRVGTDMREAAAEAVGLVDEEFLEAFGEALDFIVIQWERVATDSESFATTTNDLVRRIA